MNQGQIQKYKRRVDYLARYISRNSVDEKIKYALEKEYRRGNFYDIPKTYACDYSFINKLRTIFLESNELNQRIPMGLFEDLDTLKYAALLSNIIYKIRRGVNFDLFTIKNATTDSRISDIAWKDFKTSLENIAQTENTPNLAVRKIKLSVIDFLKEDVDKKKLLENIFIERLEKEQFGRARLVEGPLNFGALSAQYYEGKLFQTFKEIYASNFKQIELDNSKDMDLNLFEFVNGINAFFDENSIANLEDENARKNLLKQKKYLQRSVLDLEKIGCLDELINSENSNIDGLNEFLSDENKIPKISKKSLLSDINSLDVTKPEDAIRMLLMNRHFTNKLAHNYEAFVISNIYMNTVNDNVFRTKVERNDEILKRQIKEKQDRIIELYNKARLKYAEESKKGKVTDFSFANEFFEEYKEFVSKNKNATMKDLIINKNPNNEKRIRENIGSKLTKQNKQKEKTNKFEYCLEVFEELNVLMNSFDNLKLKSNGIIKMESFHDLVARILKNPKHNNDFSQLETTINGKPSNVGENVSKLIGRLRSEGVIENLNSVLSCITKRMELVKQLYATKHFFTISLVNAAQKYPQLISLEHDSPNDIDYGVVDIYYKNMMQVFGGHYKEYEVEASDSRIKLLPPVREEVRESFNNKNSKTGDTYLATYIPIKPLNEAQKNEFKKVLSIMNSVEEGKADFEDDLTSKIERFKREKPQVYETIRTRINIATNEECFIDKTKIELTPFEMQTLDFAMQAIKNGTTMDEINSMFSEKIIDYIKIIQESPKEVTQKPRTVEDAIKDTRFSNVISDEGKNKEAQGIMDKIHKEDEKQQ